MADKTDALREGQRDEVDARGQSNIATVPEPDFLSDQYNMKHRNRGTAVVINNENFRVGNLKKRDKTEEDAQAINQLLKTLGFESENINTYKDQTVAQMKETLCTVSKQDHTNSDCFVCFILSYGDDGYVYGNDDKVPIDELISYFKGDKCPTLATKPKLFFIQACKVLPRTAPDIPGRGHSTGEGVIRRIPTEADFLMAYSVIPGHLSSKGTWFIQAVVDIFSSNWETMDVMTMLTRVNRKVAEDFEKNANPLFLTQKKQISYITCMLTKNLLFTRKASNIIPQN